MVWSLNWTATIVEGIIGYRPFLPRNATWRLSARLEGQCMGFRFGWFGKWGGFTWGPRGGGRLYGYSGGRRGRKSSGCLIPFVVMLASGTFLVIAVFLRLMSAVHP